jgi:ankyrin repeat protein
MQMTAGAELPQPSTAAKPQPRISWFSVVIAAAVFVISGAIVWLAPWTTQVQPEPIETVVKAVPQKISIVVLPLKNQSDQSEHNNMFRPLSKATPTLSNSIVAGDLERVSVEIARGSDLNEPDPVLGLPLMIAAQRNQIAIAISLVKHGAEVNGSDLTGTALHAAAFGGHTVMAEFLLSAGADVNARPDGGSTPLQRAAANGHSYMIELLIRHGARIDSEPGFSSGLHQSASAGHHDAVELLIALGANVMDFDSEHNTPLHRAAYAGHAGIVEILLDAGADVSAQARAGYTPLDIAQARGNEEIIALLVQRGAGY